MHPKMRKCFSLCYHWIRYYVIGPGTWQQSPYKDYWRGYPYEAVDGIRKATDAERKAFLDSINPVKQR